MITLENNETVGIWEFMDRSLDEISDRVKAEQIVLSLVFTCYTIVGIFGKQKQTQIQRIINLLTECTYSVMILSFSFFALIIFSQLTNNLHLELF